MRVLIALCAAMAVSAPAAAQPSPRALQLAEQLTEIRDAGGRHNLESFAGGMAEEAAQGGRLTAQEKAELEKELTAAITAEVPRDKAAVARVLAREYSEAELAALVAFEGSPAARSIKAKEQRVHEALKDIGRALYDRVFQKAGDAFCARRPAARFCTEPPPQPPSGA
jgi:hypothetical protein